MIKMFAPGRLTIRARLTLVYGALFLVAGLALLAVTYFLLDQRLLQPFSFELPDPAKIAGVAGRREQRLLIQGSPDTMLYLSTQADDLRKATRASLLTQGAVALAVVGAFSIAMGWVIAGRLLSPLHRITETARRIGTAPAADRGLHERIALTGPRDELRELADTFDAMLARLDQAFDGQRRFVANASHELRTPLTLNRSLVELAMHRRTAGDDVKRLGETLLEINTRHERLINGLLLLARSENELADRSPVDLADVVEHVVAQSAGEAAAAEVQVRAEAAEAELDGDPVLLERLVQNLVDNGIRHNAAGGWVRVSSRTLPDGRRELTVANTGPVVPRYEIPVIFEPFRRLGRDRVTGQGAGLGLSIVAAITRAHGGEVVAVPREGGGLTVTVALPRG
ncbi:HAMP domain-containing sensor histidine kinase [Catellatospora sp. KI3]|uniref:sensor histidine kinase n=1 Tax=Catellatospora sp. KI3 TaxID=3041620 RepID=UPI0024824DC6|nr:HAMP domain-containing sensor histidine kinase [Catellatospora sp. KI3]MDI1464194.1 HAMP domain-containing sensor histidine kinase [Catellatospora sp. KI3]